MKSLSVVLSLFLSFAAMATEVQAPLLENYKTNKDGLEHQKYFKIQSGQTFLSFMETDIKPALDEVATSGYTILSSDQIDSLIPLLDEKVQKKIDNNGGVDVLKELADGLADETVNLNTLPEKIKDLQVGGNPYDLSTILGLLSGGGVAIEFYENNVGYNVHYDTKEKMSGRSFGFGPSRSANDASDSQYLRDLADFTIGGKRSVVEFYRTLFKALLNSDTENYKKINDEGQTLLTDFLAVYTAEQARNLMDNHISLHWDAALLEVTLLANFHAGQEDFTFYYQDRKTGDVKFTNKVYEQARCKVPTKSRSAKLGDYWQFSERITDKKNCGRSGINITKDQFRLMGEKITEYMFENHKDLSDRVKASMGIEGFESNLYKALSEYLINGETPKSLDEETIDEITEAWVDFLVEVRKSADDITSSLREEPSEGE